MLRSSSASQMMGFVLTTVNGELIVVDGGLDVDLPHLKEVILERGGRVKAWLITHPHSDHVGALTALINEGLGEITIEKIYYHLADLDWYQRNEAYRADTVMAFQIALSKLNPDIPHPGVQRGDVFSMEGATIHVMNSPYLFPVNAIKNSSVVFRVDMAGKRILFLGDLGEQGGAELLKDVPPSELKSNIVQMAHHGQYGVSKDVYAAIAPNVAMWNTPLWLWENDGGSGPNTGSYLTLVVRSWMEELGVRRNYVIKDGDQIIK